MEFIQIQVTEREERGTANANRLRRSGFVPAVLYGMGGRNLPITIPTAEIERFLRTGSHLVELAMGNETRPAIIREIQHDALSDAILHIDFVRVDKDVEIEDDVLLTFKGEAPGTKEGGVFTPLFETVTVRCRPLDIPKEIVVDINHLGMGDTITVADLDLPPNVVAVTLAETVLANVSLPKIAAEPTGEEGEAVEGAEGEGEAPAEGAAEGETPSEE